MYTMYVQYETITGVQKKFILSDADRDVWITGEEKNGKGEGKGCSTEQGWEGALRGGRYLGEGGVHEGSRSALKEGDDPTGKKVL